MSRYSIAAACSMFATLLACSVHAQEAQEKNITGSAETGIVTRGNPGEATCRSGSNIPGALRKDVRKLADQTWDLLAARNTDELWELAGSPASASLDKELFASDMHEIADRMGMQKKDGTEELFTFTFEGEYAGLAVCGARDSNDPAHRALRIASKGEDVGVAWRHSQQPPFERVLAFVYRKIGRKWRLSAVHATAVAFNGKQWSDYRDAADKFTNNTPLPRLLLLEVALAFANPTPYASTPAGYVVGNQIQELMRNKEAVAKLTRWPIGVDPLPVQQVTVITTRTALRPQVMYISKHDLDGPEAAAEAEEIAAYLRRTHPELSEHFEDVLLEGVAQPQRALKPGYPSHRAIKPLKKG